MDHQRNVEMGVARAREDALDGYVYPEDASRILPTRGSRVLLFSRKIGDQSFSHWMHKNGCSFPGTFRHEEFRGIR
eukprot:COSAG02_NODE_479_length_21477_cov_49.737674_5_plen_76_part_00